MDDSGHDQMGLKGYRLDTHTAPGLRWTLHTQAHGGGLPLAHGVVQMLRFVAEYSDLTLSLEHT
jgi:hypothetical protein